MQFAAKRIVKAFDVDILNRPAGLNPVQSNLLLLVTFAQSSTNKSGFIFSTQLRRAAMVFNQAHEGLYHAGDGQREINFDAQLLAFGTGEQGKVPTLAADLK